MIPDAPPVGASGTSPSPLHRTETHDRGGAGSRAGPRGNGDRGPRRRPRRGPDAQPPLPGRGRPGRRLDDRTSEVTDLQLQSIAHGVLSLERRSPEYGVMQRRLQVLKMRGKPFRAGYHDYAIARGGLRVFPRLVAAEHQDEFDAAQVKSGI